MPDDRSRRAARAAAVAALVFVFAATWSILSLTEDRPGWLAVEAPEVAVVGRALEIRVTLKKSVEAAQISCTLHRADSERKGWGYLASSGPSRPAAGGETHTFRFEVPERGNTADAFVLGFLSPTGRWEDGTTAATAKYMPVARDGAAATADLDPRKTRVFRYPTAEQAAKAQARAGTRRPRGRPSVWVHPALGLLLIAGAALAAVTAARTNASGPPEGRAERIVWLALAVLMAVSAVFELSGLASGLTAWGRRLAEERGVYELRRPAQKAIMAAVAAASAGLFILFIKAVRRKGSHRTLWWAGIGMAAYLAVSFVSVLSFHAVDAARSLTWQGLSPVDLVRGVGALAALLAALFAALPTARRIT